MQELYVDTPEQLQQLCDQLKGSQWLALDTEFMRERTYRAQLCLLQVSNGKIAACVDPIKLAALKPLMEIIYDPQIIKVFHAGRQDLEIFHDLYQKLPTPLFDTQLAATLLGLGDQIGYGNLVQKLLDHSLEKGHSRTDWSRRPLDEKQQRYALDDVIYLGEIYLQLVQRLEDKGRSDWLSEDFAFLANPTTYSADPNNMWQKIKGRQHLKGVQLAVLQTLTAWREEGARKANKPRRWILKDEVLIDLSRHQPREQKQLERIRGLEPGTIARRGETLLKLISDAKDKPKSEWPAEKARPARLNPNQDAVTDLLMACLRLLANDAHITPSALASRKDLEQLVTGEREIDLLHGWRRALAGESLLKVLEGDIVPRLADGKLILS
ncbi:MAG: ribonuclease D [Gammaproteobacteria bacterium]|nr:ribonuclease D [Gammaproteobacteria bacterium]